MDASKLIQLVKERRVLWDQNYKHKNKSEKMKMWVEIAMVLNSNEETVRKKWKILKDRYFRCLRESEGKERPISYKYNDQMHFLLNDSTKYPYDHADFVKEFIDETNMCDEYEDEEKLDDTNETVDEIILLLKKEKSTIEEDINSQPKESSYEESEDNIAKTMLELGSRFDSEDKCLFQPSKIKTPKKEESNKKMEYELTSLPYSEVKTPSKKAKLEVKSVTPSKSMKKKDRYTGIDYVQYFQPETTYPEENIKSHIVKKNQLGKNNENIVKTKYEISRLSDSDEKISALPSRKRKREIKSGSSSDMINVNIDPLNPPSTKEWAFCRSLAFQLEEANLPQRNFLNFQIKVFKILQEEIETEENISSSKIY